MIKSLLINISRAILCITLILSGFVKAVDPIGTQYKLQDYTEAIGLLNIPIPDWMYLAAAVILSAFEFSMGIMLLFAINRRLISRIALFFMAVMTAITVWIYIANPVSDCGCFGDAITLTNGETLLKNIILTAAAGFVAWRPTLMSRMVSLSNQWIVSHYSIVFIIGVATYSLYWLPLFDFRPYHIGANIPEGMTIPEGAQKPEFITTFIMEKDGVQKEFSLEEYPDSTWTFIDSRTIVLKEGYQPPIRDFSIQTIDEGEDITEDVLSYPGYSFLLISPHLENADDSYFGNIDQLYEYAQDYRYPFYCLTASNDDAIAKWADITGAEYPFYHTDETTLKTIIRSNPGLLLLHNGTVVGKWNTADIPVQDIIRGGKITKESAFLPAQNSTAIKITYILLWFVLPLVLLVIADRLWMWSNWLKQKETKHSNILFQSFKKQKNNGKENCSR